MRHRAAAQIKRIFTRRIKRAFFPRAAAVLLALVLLLPLPACDEKKPNTATVFAMDTVMELTVYGDESLLSGAEALILSTERKLSVTGPASEIYALNKSGAREVSPDTAELIRRALGLCAETDGALDITVYPIVRAWGFTTGEYRVPTDGELAALLELVDHRAVKISGSTVTLPAGAMLDLGAVAKGYTSDLLAAYLRENGVKSAILNLGGNVLALGTKPDGKPWRVGIADPSGDGNAAILSLSDKAVITSGGYQRYFEQDGVIYRHIIDPATGYPVDNGLASVTIIGDEGLVCDALSTALYVMGYEEAVEYWKDHPGFDAVFITSDGLLHITEGLDGSFAASGGYKEKTTEVIRRGE